MRIIINKPALAAVLIGSQLLVSFSCGKGIFAPGCGRGGSVYSFLASAEWSPQKEVYKVGDTLYLTSIIPKKLTDQINTSIVVDYSNSDGIYGSIGIGAFDTVNRINNSAKDSFDFLNLVGKVFPRPDIDFGINTLYIEKTNEYQLKIGLICKKKGLYGISVLDLLSDGIKNKHCTKASFSMSITNSDKHLHLWQNALNITLDAYPIQRNYAFRVQ